ncbi:choline/ethanolamine kinase [Hamiltosporidium tvaerminnensis]|uniref:ethanolamine kinase n=1 Tax=Hamiltosporidium tvaerminnensis TaxID=1176355 RepID=A0A4Q9L6B2_9MICR|nr:choline/ethanolamine kinase [Hamiltosporidium tvaerminnensis]
MEKDISHELQETALNILNKHIPGNTWCIELFTKGNTNTTLKCTHLAGISKNNKILILKIFKEDSNKLIDREREHNNILMLHNYKLAPQIIFTFSNGFCIEYVPGTDLEPCNLKKYSTEIAKKIKEWHSLPIKGNTILFHTLINWYNQAFSTHHKILEELQILKIINNLKIKIENKKCKLAFCHNDLLASNIIVGEDNKIYFIDYEYSGINYASFDIANHFCEYAGYSNSFENIPCEIEIKKFLEIYCFKDSLILYEEVLLFIPVAHIFWGGDFDFYGYAIFKIKEGVRCYEKRGVSVSGVLCYEKRGVSVCGVLCYEKGGVSVCGVLCYEKGGVSLRGGY